MQHSKVEKEREKAIFQYVKALDRGDTEGIGTVLQAAENDPKLERIIREINLAYQEEEQVVTVKEEQAYDNYTEQFSALDCTPAPNAERDGRSQ